MARRRPFVDTAQERIIEEFPDADLLANRLMLHLHRTTSAVLYDFESTVHRPLGSNWAVFRVLFALWLAGPLSSHAVSAVTGMSRAAVSNVSRTLLERGDIRKDDDPDDGRAVVLSITDQGLAAVREAFAGQHERERQWASLLSPEEQQILTLLLAKLMSRRHSIHPAERR